MNQSVHNKLVSFIWSIADDCLRDVYVRGKYRDVILPMLVMRRIDAMLEPTKEKVLQEVETQRKLGLLEPDPGSLKSKSGYSFYNTGKWTMQLLYSNTTNNEELLLQNFEEYLDGFSHDVKEIIDKFDIKRVIRHLSAKGQLYNVLAKFTDPNINLTPHEQKAPSGEILPALSNLGMGYVFEELIRKFNEENNEEAGEHFTPREVIRLMTKIVYTPLKNSLPNVITIYDPACGSGGMLTESEKFLKSLISNDKKVENPYASIFDGTSDGPADKLGKMITLFGQEVNDETYAICKSDMLIKGGNAENISLDSTIRSNTFYNMKFEFMLTNPPYGKSWKTEEKYVREGKNIIDPRFEVELTNFYGKKEKVSAAPRTSDGQLLFMMEMINKMKPVSQNGIGSRIASVHNGSALFTGDAESGESNIRRFIIENDLLECIVQLPNNLFYNTGITTYIWFVNNNKPEERKGRVLLIDASQRFVKLRKNLGNKNCELSEENIDEIQQAFERFEDIEPQEDDALAAKVFRNEEFGYYKVEVQRPKRLRITWDAYKIRGLRFDESFKEPMEYLYEQYGERVYSNIRMHRKEFEEWAREHEITFKKKADIDRLFNPEYWLKQKNNMDIALQLPEILRGVDELDANTLKEALDKAVREIGKKITATEKNKIIRAVTVQDDQAAPVIDKEQRYSGKKLDALLDSLGCTEEELPMYGYFPGSRPSTYITYEDDKDLKDTENIPLTQDIKEYFKKEVLPFAPDAWIKPDNVKIGYEISFNKYFYRHKKLRERKVVEQEIIKLDADVNRLMRKIFEEK